MELTDDDLSNRLKKLEPAYRRTVYQALVDAEENEKKDFRRRVHELPPELFEMVKEYTFTYIQARVKIDKDYKPPSCLQVDRFTRNRGWTAYRRSIFKTDDEELLYRWVSSMDEWTRGPNSTIRFDTHPELRSPATDVEATKQASDILKALRQRSQGADVLLSILDVCVNVRFPSDGKEMWTRSPAATLAARQLGRSSSFYEPRIQG